MKLGFSFFGIIYGPGGRTGSDRDFKHCWPDLKKDLIDPFVDLGHTSKIYFSGYRIRDNQIEKDFYDLVKPDKVNYSHQPESNPFTTKYAAFNNFMDEDIDAIVFTRSDIHFSKIMAKENIDFTKFNFLFPELDYWDSNKFTTDNFYVIPKMYFKQTLQAMEDTYAWPRGKPFVDTHGLWEKLANYISEDNFHFISQVHEKSDVNSFYTLCRSELPINDERIRKIHPAVAERFNYKQ